MFRSLKSAKASRIGHRGYPTVRLCIYELVLSHIGVFIVASMINYRMMVDMIMDGMEMI